MQIAVHPNVYKTSNISGLISALEMAWVRGMSPGDGTLYAISGFANYNGGVRFYDVFKNHIDRGGKVIAIFGGSSVQRLSSKQVVTKLLECGVDVEIVNRKRLMHMKCYGSKRECGQNLVISSGNFTGPGMSQNVEMSIFLENTQLMTTNFSWDDFIQNIHKQNWLFYKPNIDKSDDPCWKLLYDEQGSNLQLDDTNEVSLIITLNHSDTVRINASQGSKESLGTQYFWLSKDCFDFFPPLTILNRRGSKSTYSCMIEMNYIDIGVVSNNTRVTFEAENNLDFRLGTGVLKNTRIADINDIALISRISENQYELRIIKKNNKYYFHFLPYATIFIGNRGKKYGFVSNQIVSNILDTKIGRLYPSD